LAFARRGSRVVIADLDLEAAEKVAAACREAGGDADPHAVDVADRGQVVALADAVLSEHGVPDVVVNNAGVGMAARFTDTTPDDWDWILGVNLHGVINGCAAFGPALLERGRGHVVNVSSGLGYTPRATEPAYVTTKAAVLALSRSLRADWAPRGVGVSAICPGVIATGIIGRSRFRGDRAEPERVEHVDRLFQRGHSADKVASAVVRAVERNRAVVPVGWEARLGWWFSRLGPLWLQERVARQEPI
jgi:NAD(P)-dependent dehydrogenase (short-subunit alcohol dehydrogenase family)